MFYDTLKKLCDDAGTTPHAVCLALGLSQGAAPYWKKFGYFRYICNTKCNMAALCKIDILQAQYLCNHTKFDFLQTFCRFAIDFLQTLCYNIIKEREGKPRGNPREQTEV